MKWKMMIDKRGKEERTVRLLGKIMLRVCKALKLSYITISVMDDIDGTLVNYRGKKGETVVADGYGITTKE